MVRSSEAIRPVKRMHNRYSRLAFALLDDEARQNIAWSNAAANPYIDECTDCDGRVIRRSDYGKTTAFGWEIDHIMPSVFGGPDVAHNVRARHWQGNRSAGGAIGAGLKENGRGGLFGLFGLGAFVRGEKF